MAAYREWAQGIIDAIYFAFDEKLMSANAQRAFTTMQKRSS
jgi:hypothetical protein